MSTLDPARTPGLVAKRKRAEGYRWKQADAGNYLALRHGAHSPRLVGPLAEQLAADLLEQRPDLCPFGHEVAAWSWAETQAALLRLAIDEGGVIGEDGEPRSGLLGWLNRVERRAAESRRELGLTPRAAAGLARERAEAALSSWSADEIVEAGRRVIDVTATDGNDG